MSDYRKRAEAYMVLRGWVNRGQGWWTRRGLVGDLLFETALSTQLREDAAIIFDKLGV